MTHTIEKTVENYMEACHMLDGVQNIVAGVSGGPDSMCMLHILYRFRERYRYRLTVVHVHHGIRGQAADEDMEYVKQCCGKWGIEIRLFCYKVEEQAIKWHMSTEEAGRKLRYDCFSEVLENLGGGKISFKSVSGNWNCRPDWNTASQAECDSPRFMSEKSTDTGIFKGKWNRL